MKTKPYLFSTTFHPDTIYINPLKISFIQTNINFSQYDYIILTSKQAVKALTKYTYKKQALCISKETARSFEDIGGIVLEVGSGYGDNLLEIIRLYPKETKWLYLRAKEVASDFVKMLIIDGYNIDERVVYKSECSQDIKDLDLEEKATLIFTSPSSVKCFLKYNKFKKDNIIVVIGKTTAKAVPSCYKTIVAHEPSIQSCLKIINLI